MHAPLAVVYSNSVFFNGIQSDEKTTLAIHHAGTALKLDSSNTTVRAFSAETYLIVGKHDLAQHHIDKAIALNPNDFVVMGQIPEDDKLETYPFLENILVPVAHPKHPLAKKKKVSLEELVNERFLVREEGSGTRLVFDRLLKKNNLHIEPYMELGSSEALKQAVMAGLGLAILSLHSLRLEQAAKKLVVLDVEGFPLKRRWFAVHMKGKKLSLVAQTFHDFIIAESNNILDFKKK